MNIQTKRLFLRPLTLFDALDGRRLAADKDIASNTKDIAPPYEDSLAQKWIGSCLRPAKSNELVHFAITLANNTEFMGAVTLHMDFGLGSTSTCPEEAELSYWVG